MKKPIIACRWIIKQMTAERVNRLGCNWCMRRIEVATARMGVRLKRFNAKPRATGQSSSINDGVICRHHFVVWWNWNRAGIKLKGNWVLARAGRRASGKKRRCGMIGGKKRDFLEFPAGLLRCRFPFPTQKSEKSTIVRSVSARSRQSIRRISATQDEIETRFIPSPIHRCAVWFIGEKHRKVPKPSLGREAWRFTEKFKPPWHTEAFYSIEPFHFAAHPHDRLKINPSAAASSKFGRKKSNTGIQFNSPTTATLILMR